MMMIRRYIIDGLHKYGLIWRREYMDNPTCVKELVFFVGPENTIIYRDRLLSSPIKIAVLEGSHYLELPHECLILKDVITNKITIISDPDEIKDIAGYPLDEPGDIQEEIEDVKSCTIYLLNTGKAFMVRSFVGRPIPCFTKQGDLDRHVYEDVYGNPAFTVKLSNVVSWVESIGGKTSVLNYFGDNIKDEITILNEEV